MSTRVLMILWFALLFIVGCEDYNKKESHVRCYSKGVLTYDGKAIGRVRDYRDIIRFVDAETGKEITCSGDYILLE